MTFKFKASNDDFNKIIVSKFKIKDSCNWEAPIKDPYNRRHMNFGMYESSNCQSGKNSNFYDS